MFEIDCVVPEKKTSERERVRGGVIQCRVDTHLENSTTWSFDLEKNKDKKASAFYIMMGGGKDYIYIQIEGKGKCKMRVCVCKSGVGG